MDPIGIGNSQLKRLTWARFRYSFSMINDPGRLTVHPCFLFAFHVSA